MKEENKILEILQQNQLILFFKFKNKIYGTNEDNRLMFARLKDEDENGKWKKEAKFSAFDIETLKDEKKEHLFGMKDLDNIKIVNRDEIIKKLSKEEK